MFTVGYGDYGHIQYRTEQAIKGNKCIRRSIHLTVIYERTINSATDFLHLQIDTTFRSIGKGQFVYETICDRTISLQSSAGEQFTDDEARQCFVEGATRKWVKLEDRHFVEGYDCLAAVAATEKGTWQAWYTTALPHCPDGTTTTDGLSGLILMLRNSQADYQLRATTIDLNIG